MLPPGEELLWQGAPDGRSLALHAFHVRNLGAYFALMVLARGAYLLASGEGFAAAVAGMAGPAFFALIALGILTGIALLAARRCVYSITNKRVVIRQGIALESTINLPFALIESAAIKERVDGSGDVAITLQRNQRVSYLWLWPHVRPWHITRPQPSLRCLRDVQKAGAILARAFTAAAPQGTHDEAGERTASGRAGDTPTAGVIA
jgi:hypothetical protein